MLEERAYFYDLMASHGITEDEIISMTNDEFQLTLNSILDENSPRIRQQQTFQRQNNQRNRQTTLADGFGNGNLDEEEAYRLAIEKSLDDMLVAPHLRRPPSPQNEVGFHSRPSSNIHTHTNMNTNFQRQTNYPPRPNPKPTPLPSRTNEQPKYTTKERSPSCSHPRRPDASQYPSSQTKKKNTRATGISNPQTKTRPTTTTTVTTNNLVVTNSKPKISSNTPITGTTYKKTTKTTTNSRPPTSGISSGTRPSANPATRKTTTTTKTSTTSTRTSNNPSTRTSNNPSARSTNNQSTRTTNNQSTRTTNNQSIKTTNNQSIRTTNNQSTRSTNNPSERASSNSSARSTNDTSARTGTTKKNIQSHPSDNLSTRTGESIVHSSKPSANQTPRGRTTPKDNLNHPKSNYEPTDDFDNYQFNFKSKRNVNPTFVEDAILDPTPDILHPKHFIDDDDALLDRSPTYHHQNSKPTNTKYNQPKQTPQPKPQPPKKEEPKVNFSESQILRNIQDMEFIMATQEAERKDREEAEKKAQEEMKAQEEQAKKESKLDEANRLFNSIPPEPQNGEKAVTVAAQMPDSKRVMRKFAPNTKGIHVYAWISGQTLQLPDEDKLFVDSFELMQMIGQAQVVDKNKTLEEQKISGKVLFHISVL